MEKYRLFLLHDKIKECNVPLEVHAWFFPDTKGFLFCCLSRILMQLPSRRFFISQVGKVIFNDKTHKLMNLNGSHMCDSVTKRALVSSVW